jgi:hypothetical protein
LLFAWKAARSVVAPIAPLQYYVATKVLPHNSQDDLTRHVNLIACSTD